MILFSIFAVFFFIGVYNFGGGYAMVPLIISLVVEKYGWITLEEFINFLTISQVTPGPIAINLATFIGYTVGNGVIGAITTTIAVILPSFIIISLIVIFMKKFKNNVYVDKFFIGIRPVVLGLIATSALSVIDRSFFSIYGITVFSLVFYLTTYKNLHPIIAIFATGLIGMFFV